MSQQLRALQWGFDAWWKRGEFTGFEALPDDFESESRFGLDFSCRGREEFMELFRGWKELWEGLETTYEFEEVGEGRVLVNAVTRGRGPQSGVDAAMSFSQVWFYEAGAFRRVIWFGTREQALAYLDA